MTPANIIKRLESTNSRLQKESILELAISENLIELINGIKYCLDPLITFGIKQVPEMTIEQDKELSWNEFKFYLDCFLNRELTGNAAKQKIIDLMNQSNPTQWNNWYRRILLKDLKCGISDKTFNKVCKKLNLLDLQVPVFSVQLATDGNKHQKKLSGTKILENKLDGIRVMSIVYPNGKVNLYSRNGKELNNFNFIEDEFKDNISPILSEPMVFDGEVISNNFQNLMKQVHRKDDIDTSDSILFLFDSIPLSEFQKGKSLSDQNERKYQLNEYKKYFNKYIQIIDYTVVDLDIEEGQIAINEFNEDSLSKGFEGIMVKDPNAIYECKRSFSWLKIKPSISLDLSIVAVEEGTGRNEGKLGALVCEGYDGEQFIRVNVGSGLSDENREEFWKSKDTLIGQIVEVMADSITQSQDESTVYSLRFPRFKTFRSIEKGEKI